MCPQATWHIAADPLLNMDISSLAACVSCAVLSYTPQLAAPASAPGQELQEGNGQLRTEFAPRTPSSSGQPDVWTPAIRTAVWHMGGTEPREESMAGDWLVTPGAAGSRVVTLVIPHDLTWDLRSSPPTPPRSYSPGSHASSGAGQTAGCESTTGTVLAAAEPGGSEEGLDRDWELLPPVAVEFMRNCAAALRACPAGKAALYLGGEALVDVPHAGGGPPYGGVF